MFNKPKAQMTVGRMSLKGAIPKKDMQDEPFLASPSEESKVPLGAKQAQNQTAAYREETKDMSASKEPVMGLDSNNN